MINKILNFIINNEGGVLIDKKTGIIITYSNANKRINFNYDENEINDIIVEEIKNFVNKLNKYYDNKEKEN